MSSPASHYREAERLAATVGREVQKTTDQARRLGLNWPELNAATWRDMAPVIALAQVHATLATANVKVSAG
jgi:hypothetical protein